MNSANTPTGDEIGESRPVHGGGVTDRLSFSITADEGYAELAHQQAADEMQARSVARRRPPAWAVDA